MAFSDAFNNTQRTRIARSELDLKKKAMDAELVKSGYNPSDLSVVPGGAADVQRAENQRALQLSEALQGKLAAQDTDQAILDFADTGDANYLQGALDKNPFLKQAWGQRGVQNIANLDWQNDANLLAQNGFKPSEYDTEEKQDLLKKNIYKYYDGQKWNVGMLNNVVQETGALGRIGKNRGQRLIDNYQGMRDFMASPKSSGVTAEGSKYSKEIQAAADETGVPANLIASIIRQESDGNSKAVSKKGAQGLMQLMPETAKELGVTDPFDPSQNIMAGAKYLAKQLETYNGNTSLALAAYNAGPGNVNKYNGVPPFAETQNYITKVLGNYSNAESYYSQDPVVLADASNIKPYPGVNDVMSDASERQNNYNDNRINTIQNFNRGNANAAKGLTNAQVDAASENERINSLAALRKANNEGITTTQKDLKAAENLTTEMVDKFGGEDAFFKTDFSDPKTFNEAWNYVVKINKLQGNEYTQEDRKKISDIRQLLVLADPAAKLSADQTGLIDNTLSNVEKYISDNSDGIDSKAAMAAFRNTLRNALYGATLTDGEIEAFNEAFGNNKQKLGPVLEQFKVALAQVKSNLDSVSNLGNPYTSRVLLGVDQKRMDLVTNALQNSINKLEGRAPEKSPEARAARKPLDDIFSGNKQ